MRGKQIRKRRKVKKQVKVLMIGILLVLGGFFLIPKSNKYSINKVALAEYATINYDKSDHVYLSDLDYVETLENEKVTYAKDSYDIHFDKSNSGDLLKLNVNGTTTSFIKGLSAWATSSIVYDLTNIKNNNENVVYDYFTAYLGVEASQVSTYFNSGVVFTISTSNDGKTWETKHKTKVLKGWDDAEFVQIDISNCKYLKLYADQNGGNWWDHWYDDALYADAKLITKDYTEKVVKNDNVLPLAEYDQKIKEAVNKNTDYQNILLKREFVNRVSYDILQALMNYSEDYTDIINWIMNDEDILYLYLLGGEPDGNYVSSLKILDQLYKKYQNDLNDSKNGDLYLKMMITLSLTHSANVGSWITGAPEDPNNPNGSNALVRYQLYKKLYNEGLLNNDIFTNISVEEMRFVMNNIIADEEIEWLNHYTRDYAKSNNFTAEEMKNEKEKNPYTYITYTFDYDYSKEQYYNSNNKAKWDKTYSLSKYNLPYHETSGYPKLWVVFEEGSVCGGLSKTGSNIRGVYGIPSSVVSQPGHAAYIYMSLDKDNNKVWSLYNDVSGWGQSGKTEKLSTRMPLGWGSGEYAQEFPASYVLLAQAALNDYDNYKASEEKLMLASVYNDDNEKLESIYREALKIQDINFDAWYGLLKLYEKKNASINEYYGLAEEIVDHLTYYPRAMYDLVSQIETHFPKKSVDLANLHQLIRNSLEKATVATNKDVLQPGPCQAVAKYILSQRDPLATFSFDGDKAGMIVLSDSFEGNKWQYSLDGDENWTDTYLHEVKLSPAELAMINETNDILVRIYGANSTYGIDITKPNKTLGLYANDLENKVIGINDKMQWRIEGTDEWTSYKTEFPDLSGDKVVYVRTGPTGQSVASDEDKFSFNAEEKNETKSYVPISRLSIASFSSEQNTGSDGSKNALDGNSNTIWHTKWDKSDKELYFTIKLNEPTYLSALEYVPRQDGTNGRVLSAKISVSMDGENFETIVEETDWKNDASNKMVDFTESVKASYIKIEGLKTSNDFMSAAMFNLFEDQTKMTSPTADIEYSNKNLTNKNVEVKLVNPSKEITITNNGGSNIYVFQENGDFTFEFVDNYGNNGTATASVNWIDKILPTAKIIYSTTSKTNQEVVAKLISDEDIKILNNNGKDSYTFTSNGSFEFVYQDPAGNKNTTIATVDWITPKNNSSLKVENTINQGSSTTKTNSNNNKSTTNQVSNNNVNNELNNQTNQDNQEPTETNELQTEEESSITQKEETNKSVSSTNKNTINNNQNSPKKNNNLGKIVFGIASGGILIATIFLGLKIKKIR